MKKFVFIATLLALLTAAFAIPSFAEEGCDPNADYLTIGHEQLENGDFNGALHSANCGISFGNNLRAFYYLRADIYCDMGNAEASIADFTTVIELEPTADAYNYRGWA